MTCSFPCNLEELKEEVRKSLYRGFEQRLVHHVYLLLFQLLHHSFVRSPSNLYILLSVSILVETEELIWVKQVQVLATMVGNRVSGSWPRSVVFPAENEFNIYQTQAKPGPGT